MSDWLDNLADLAEAPLDAFGEPVTLADASVVTGIFDPIGEPAAAPWSEVGLAVRVSQQPNPSVWLADSVAQALDEQDALTIRGQAYLITRKDADGSGLTRCALMPDTSTTNDLARWR
jgi:hypothetical protein